jgi:hypothetical protein
VLGGMGPAALFEAVQPAPAVVAAFRLHLTSTTRLPNP